MAAERPTLLASVERTVAALPESDQDAAAVHLARKGWSVGVFEAKGEAGGAVKEIGESARLSNSVTLNVVVLPAALSPTITVLLVPVPKVKALVPVLVTVPLNTKAPKVALWPPLAVTVPLLRLRLVSVVVVLLLANVPALTVMLL